MHYYLAVPLFSEIQDCEIIWLCLALCYIHSSSDGLLSSYGCSDMRLLNASVTDEVVSSASVFEGIPYG